jgi:hypothetical protein
MSGASIAFEKGMVGESFDLHFSEADFGRTHREDAFCLGLAHNGFKPA